MKHAKNVIVSPVIAISVAIFAALGAGAGGLPQGYTPLEYIESTGTQYIDTKLLPTGITTFEVRYQLTELPGTTTSGVLGYSGASPRLCFGIASGGVNVGYYNSGNTLAFAGQPDLNIHTATLAARTYYLDGIKVRDAYGETWKDTPKSLYLFAYNSKGTVANFGKLRLYACSFKNLKDANGATVDAEFVPCRDSHEAVGLYEKVSNTFYTNAATTGDDFTPGPKIDILVTGSPAEYGTPNPAYGWMKDLTPGETYTFNPPADGEADGLKWHCTGWEFVTEGGVKTRGTDVASITYQERGTLTWLFTREYKVEFACTGGDVDTNKLWYAEGETVTVTFSPDEGRAFFKWGGDVAATATKANPLVLMVDGPKSITALTGGYRDVPSQYATVPEAITAATDGDTVRVAEGYYNLSGTAPISVSTKAVNIVGAGIDRTWFTNSSASVTLITLNNKDASMSGFTVSNVYVGARATSPIVNVKAGVMSHFKMTQCTGGNATDGLVFKLSGADAVVTHALFVRNVPWSSGTANMLWVSDGATLENTLVTGTAQSGSGAKGKAGGCTAGGGAYVSGAATLRNCSFIGNKANKGGGIYVKSPSAGQTHFINCTFAGSTAPSDTGVGKPEIFYESTWNEAFSNCFENCAFGSGVGPIGAGGVSVTDADFKDLAGGDYRWAASSPAVDAGADYSSMAAKDLAGNARVLDNAIDIGCYEFAEGDIPGCSFTLSPLDGFAPLDVASVAKVTGGKGKTLTYAWTVKNESKEEPDVTATDLAPAFTLATPGKRTVTMRVYEGGNLFAELARTNYVNVCVRTNYLAAADAPDVTPAYPYDTPETAAKVSLNEFLTSAVAGQTTILGEGVFTLDNSLITVAQPLTILGAGMDRTILTRSATTLKAQVFHLNHPQAVLDGVTISNVVGEVNDAGIVKLGINGGKLLNSKLVSCQGGNASSGCCVSLLSADALLSHCVFTKCKGWGSGNTSIIWAEKGTMDNCLVSGGSAYQTGAVRLKGSCSVNNCTIVNNTSSKLGGGIYTEVSTGHFRNCVIANNKAPNDTGAGAPEYWTNLTAANQTNVFNGCAFGSGVPLIGTNACSVTDTDFVNVSDDDWHLKPSSALVNRGVAYEGIAETDLDGNPRVNGKAPDIGCYEADSSVITCSIRVNPEAAFPGDTFLLTPSVSGAEGRELTYRWEIENASVLGEPVVVSTEGEHERSFATCGRRNIKLEVFENGEPLVSALASNVLHVAARTNYLEVAGAPGVIPAYPYDTPETASTGTVHELYAEMIPLSTMCLGEGEFRLAETLTVEQGVTFVGAGADRTIVTGASDGKFIKLNASEALVSHLTISNLYGGIAGGIVNIGAQGGKLSDVRIVKCQNTVATHGAIVNMSSSNARLLRCDIRDNTNPSSSESSTVWADAGVMENCLVCGNKGGTQGGGIRLGAATVRNCTICDNAGAGDYQGNYKIGGVYFNNGAGSLINCVIAGNHGDKGTEYGGSSASKTIRNCAWGSGVDLLGEVAVAVDYATAFRNVTRRDYRPRRDSPLVDKGRNEDWMTGATDLAGKRRVVNGTVDIGCYENQQLGLMLMVR